MGTSQRFWVVRDDEERAVAIAVEGRWIAHLVSGSHRNEANAEKLVAVLNAAVAVVGNPAWAGVSDEDVALAAAIVGILSVRATK